MTIARRTKLEEHCEWLTRELMNTQEVTRAGFEDQFGNVEPDEWSRVSRSVVSTLRGADISVEIKDKQALVLKSRQPLRFENRFFQPSEYTEEKNRIGWLVANYLKHRQDRHVLLGSGSTVFHVGRNMKYLAEKRGETYEQLFWTVNIALAALWCEGDSSPVAQVQIPKGELRTATFRYASMENPDWNCPIAVVGADGCYFHGGNATLYANEPSIANNTNHFAGAALDSVICCIASSKLTYSDHDGQNAGPPIQGPPRGRSKDGSVKWFLVTDSKLDKGNPKTEALKKGGWIIVSELADWYSDVPGGRKFDQFVEYRPISHNRSIATEG